MNKDRSNELGREDDIMRPSRSVPLYRRFLRLLNARFVAPQVQDPEIRNREIVLNVMLVGTMAILGLATLMVLTSYLAQHRTYLLPRALIMAGSFVLLIGIYNLARHRQYRFAAHLLVVVYILLAALSAYRWGIDLPAGILLDALIVTMAGVLLGARYSLYAAFVLTIILSLIGYGHVRGTIIPDRQWVTEDVSPSSIIGFVLVFAVLSLVTWLFNYQINRALHRALRAENALLRQKITLEVQVEKRTRDLQAAQFEKVQQMYRFAELGQLSTALLHELANHLATLTLDIEGLEQRRGSSQVVKRAKQSIGYIDDMVKQVRQQLHGKHESYDFSVDEEIDKVVAMLQRKARQRGVQIQRPPEVDNKQSLYHGDAVRLRQMLSNIISNAIDAYDRTETVPEHRLVAINTEKSKDKLHIHISDWGKGIAPENLRHVFDPFYSTKADGMGLGLFVTKQIAEQYFGGSVDVSSHHGCTTFILTLRETAA